MAQYWYNYLAPNYEFSLSSVETQHFQLTVTVKDPSIPKTFWEAMKKLQWAAAINKERAKFEVNNSLAELPFTNQHLRAYDVALHHQDISDAAGISGCAACPSTNGGN